MQSDEHRALHHAFYYGTNGVTPSSAGYGSHISRAHVNDPLAGEPSQDEPDAFYRGYSPMSTNSPSTADILVSGAVSNMATIARPRQPQPNGVPTPRTVPRPAFRSASGPTPTYNRPGPGPPGTSQSAKVQNLVKRFDQTAANSTTTNSRYRTPRTSTGSEALNLSHTHTPTAARPAPNVQYGPHRLNNLKPRERKAVDSPTSPGRTRRLTKERQSLEPRSTQSEQNLSNPVKRATPVRPLFFGEVIGDNNEMQLPGYGIPSLSYRRGSDGSMQQPNSIFTHTRSHSNIEDSYLAHLTGRSQDEQYSRDPSAEGHRRSRSDLSGIAQPHIKEHFMTNPDMLDSFKVQAPAIPNERQRSPPSRIPVLKRRPSEVSDSGSSRISSRASSAMGGARYVNISPSRDSRAQPKTHPGKENMQQKRSRSPTTTLTSKRYGPSPNKPPGNGQSLKAVIREPLPKTSPPLRHSRTRQPLSTASTSSSRAKSSEPVSTSRHQQVQTTTKARKERGTAELDLPERRAPFENIPNQPFNSDPSARHRVVKAKGEKEDRHRPEPGSEGYDSDSKHATVMVTALSIDGHGPNGPDNLTLDTNLTPGPLSQEPLTAATEFENVDSPVLGMPGSFPNADVTPLVQSEAEHLEPQIVVDEATPMDDMTFSQSAIDTGLGDEPQSQQSKESLLGHVMGLRKRSSSAASRTTFAEDEAPLREDGESINIVLGQTPAFPSSREGWPGYHNVSDGQREEHIPWQPDPAGSCSEGTSFIEEAEESPIDPFDARSSIRPDESVSVVFRSRNTPSDWTPTIPNLPQDYRQTLDTEAYNTIHEVLDYYRGSDFIPLQKAQEFRQKIQGFSPSLASHAEWTSKEATEYLLQNLLNDGPPISPDMQNQNSKTSKDVSSHSHGVPDIRTLENSPDIDHHGIAIIYQQPERYSRESPYRPTPPPKDWRYSPHLHSGFVGGTQGAPGSTDFDRPQLPEIPTGEGLGLAIQVSATQESTIFTSPPLPNYSPPPPPAIDGVNSYSPSVYTRYPPSSILPFAPLDASNTSHPVANVKLDDPSIPSLIQALPKASLETAREPSPEKDSPEQKRLKKRRHVIKELIDTENTFNQDMKVMEDIYKGTSIAAAEVKDDDRKVIFGNSTAVVEFSQTFFDALRHATASVYILPKEKRWNHRRGSFSTSHSAATDQSSASGSAKVDPEQDRKTTIGAVFNSNLTMMESVFGDYIKNHDAANQRLAVLQEIPKVKLWLGECHEYGKDLTDAWNLDALLVKPTQRILKYPLILGALIECTPDDHPDYAALVAAKEELKAISNRINSAKKRADLVDTVTNRKRKESDVRLNLSKAFGRRTEKLKQQVGLADTVDDQEYDALAQKFGGHFFQLQIVMRDVEKYLDDVQAQFDQINNYVAGIVAFIDVSQSANPEIESKWRRYAQVMGEITSVALPEHKMKVRKSVIEPIMTLWKLHDQPQKMMQKRKKRVVDYAKFKAQLERSEKPDKKLQEQADSFVILNDTLKLELPKLYALTKRLAEACLSSFINIQMTWQSTLQRKTQSVMERPQTHNKPFSQDLDDIVQEFKSDYGSVEAEVLTLSMCNKSLMAEAANFLSPTATFVTDDSYSFKRPSLPGSNSRRTQSIHSDQSTVSPTPDSSQRNSGSLSFPYFDSTSPLDALSQPSPVGRMRAGSGVSSRGPSTPRSLAANAQVTPNPSQRPSTATGRPAETSQSYPRLSLEMEQRPGVPLLPTQQAAYNRSSAIFSSAMPMSDSPVATRAVTPEPPTQEEPEVLFLAASLFEFNIANDRREGGIPYLVYVPGEIFDVIGQKGELWLARNQDDPYKRVGWIWEKHFARILSDES